MEVLTHQIVGNRYCKTRSTDLRDPQETYRSEGSLPTVANMALEAQFASLDGTAFGDMETNFKPDPNAIARRSISIFSRRGTETPEPTPPFIAQEAMRTPRQLTERQKSWIKRKSVPVSTAAKKPSGTTPKGTILNAVPPAKIIQMTPLEEEMATSPNDEILSALESPSPSQLAFKSPFHRRTPSQASNTSTTPTSPVAQQKNGFWSKTALPLSQRTKSQRKREHHQTRIGIWVHGIAHWDDQALVDCTGWEEPSLEDQTGFTPLAPIPVTGLNGAQTKPTLKVTIPDNERIVVSDTTVSTIVEPMPRRPVVSVAPASIVNKFVSSRPTSTTPTTPTITVDELYDVTPIEERSRVTPPLERPRAPKNADSTDAIATDNRPRLSESSSYSSGPDGDDSSELSHGSSATSMEVLAGGLKAAKEKSFDVSPIAPPPSHSNARTPNVNKPLPPPPCPQRAAPTPPQCSPTKDGNKAERSFSTKSVPEARMYATVQPLRPLRSSRSLSELDLIDLAFLSSAPDYFDQADSPTLSQAADDLEAHLSTIAEDNADVEEGDQAEEFNEEEPTEPIEQDDQGQEVNEEQPTESSLAKSGSVHRSDSVRSVMQPPERAPTLPKRSRKREWRQSPKYRHVVQLAKDRKPRRRRSDSNIPRMPTESIGMLRRVTSMPRLSTPMRLPIELPKEPATPSRPRIVIDDGLIVLHGPVRVENGAEESTAIASTSAEDVLLQILSSLSSTKDLFNTALINKGMYRVYKENEMDLLRAVTYNQSPAAFEYREWCPPTSSRDSISSDASSQLEHTPLSYMSSYRRDVEVIESLKSLVLQHCGGFIRKETAIALSSRTHPHAQRFDDAFWRICCFSKIFGCGKGREEDVTGQLDWLKGGLLANNQDLTATMNMNLDYDMSSVLLNPPDFFAKGNGNGLSAQQLYDMTELWSCLATIMSGYHGRVDQARQNGVFDGCEIFDGDEEAEEQTLEEWVAYLLTLGPAVILEMAEFATDASSAGFALARVNGWTQWSSAQSGGSRTTFLKEPLARLYEERVTAAALRLQNPRDQERKEMSRKRVANLAAEIKLARQASSYKRLPLIDMSMERPMSAMSRRTSVTSTCSFRSQSSIMNSRVSSPVQRRTLNFSVPRPRSPPSNLWSPRRISPIIEDRVETFNRMSLQNFAMGVAEDTSELAVKRIMDMGFAYDQAIDALRLTDMGDGLRVDRAVDLLLRRR